MYTVYSVHLLFVHTIARDNAVLFIQKFQNDFLLEKK